MLDETYLATWREWAGTAVSGDAAQREAAARIGAMVRLLGGTEDDSAGAAQSAAQVQLSDDALSDASPKGTLGALRAAGWELPGLASSPFVLNAGEKLIATAGCNAWVFKAVARKKGHAWVGGTGPVGMTLLAASAVGNAARTTKSASDAAARWRPLGQSTLCITNQRVLRHADVKWNAYPIGNVLDAQISDNHGGIVVRLRGQEQTPFMYEVVNAGLWLAVLSHTGAAATPAQGQAVTSVTVSDDGRYWWDGSTWNDLRTSLPPASVRSEDGHHWWDGASWRQTPA